MTEILNPLNFKTVEAFEHKGSSSILNNTSCTKVVSGVKDITCNSFMPLPMIWYNEGLEILKKEHKNDYLLFSNTYRTKGLYLSYMSEAKLVDGVVFTEDEKIHRDTYYHHFGAKVKEIQAKSKHIREPVFYIGNTKEHYHWILDCLSGLMLRSSTQQLEGIKILITNPTDFKMNTLEVYGIDSRQILVCESKKIKIDHIFIPSTVGGGQAYAPYPELKEFHNRSVENIRPDHSGKKYYISRSRTSRRHLINEKGLEDMLVKLGFSVVYLEEYSFTDQIKLMKSASLIVAPHGAGLTNIVYCNTGTVLIELLCEFYLNPCFYKLAAICNLSYVPILSKDHSLVGLGVGNHNFEWNVNIGHVLEAIDYIEKAGVIQ